MAFGRTTGIAGVLSAFAAVLSPISADAGLKYRDADDYVQDGLVMHYDGIRNAGLSSPHDSAATVWVNLASPGTYDLTRYYRPSTKSWYSGSGTGWWTDDGFHCTNSYFGTDCSFTFPASYTIQVLCDAKSADQKLGGSDVGYILFPQETSACVLRYNADGTCRFAADGAIGTTTSNVNLPRFTSDQLSYITAVLSGNSAAIFSGTSAPASGALADGYFSSATKTATAQVTTNFRLGGGQGYTQDFNGTIKSFRLYSRVLSEAEMVTNRLIDNVRFFGSGVLPVTNVVLASTLPALCGTEANGNYAVDEEGYTFTATNVTDRGITYAPTGYTLETWDASAGTWGDAIAHDGASYAATDAGKVRLRWRWEVVSGLLSAASFDVQDYVQEGLVLDFDGIRNAGFSLPHDSAATAWSNIANPGVYDMALSGAVAWGADGFVFDGATSFTIPTFTLPTAYTVQILLDAIPAEQTGVTGYLFYQDTDWTKGSLSLKSDIKGLDFACHGFMSFRPRVLDSATDGAYRRFSYLTATLDANHATLFEGTEEPASGAGYQPLGSGKTVAPVVTSPLHVGGTGTQRFCGTMKSFRFYDRVLSAAEMAHNRAVDNARFFGILPAATNVVVASSHAFLSGAEANGNYFLAGAHTFTAPLTATDRGVKYALEGYTIEAWDASAGKWGEPGSHDGASYEADGTGKIRLTWQWRATEGLRSAADYAISDYVGSGLVMNYDGLCNAGAGNARDASAVRWVNAAPAGGYDLTRFYRPTTRTYYRGDGAGYWTDDGFRCTNSYFGTSSPFTFPATYTIQALCAANGADQTLQNSDTGYLLYPDPIDVAILRFNSNGMLLFAANGALGTTTSAANLPRFTSDPLSYVTAILSGGTATVFSGTTAPLSGGLANGYFSSATMTATAQTASNFRIGGGQGYSQDFNGTIKNFRLYDRVLTADELARNRQVDCARYFGALAVTNVFVVAGGGEQTEVGAYAVEGSWTFTATSVRGRNGDVKPVARHAIETLVDGQWAGKTWHDGASYTYTAGSSPSTVRVTWRELPLGTVLMVK